MLRLRDAQGDDGLLSSTLLNQDNFYNLFTRDLLRAKQTALIESPFLSFKRVNYLMPTFRKLARREVRIIVNTKPLDEQDSDYSWQVAECIAMLQDLGVEVLITGGHHRKLAIIDQQILYEGSLNILSQNESCEIMRRIHSEQLAMQMIEFISLGKFIG